MSEYVLYHHGIKGQKWGVRRFQNKDGSLTKAGKERQNERLNWSKEQQKEFASTVSKSISDNVEGYEKLLDKLGGEKALTNLLHDAPNNELYRTTRKELDRLGDEFDKADKFIKDTLSIYKLKVSELNDKFFDDEFEYEDYQYKLQKLARDFVGDHYDKTLAWAGACCIPGTVGSYVAYLLEDIPYHKQ